MDVTLGVTVEGVVARIALLDAAAPHAVVDQSQIDLTDEPLDTLAETLVSTDRMLAESGHRLVATAVCSSDAGRAAQLRDALVDADLTDVTVVSTVETVTALTRVLAGGETTASLVSDGDTAALSIVDTAADTTSLIAVEPIVDGDSGAAYRALLERFSEEPGGATSVVVLGALGDRALTADLNQTSPVPVHFPDNPEFAMARGTALAGLASAPTSAPRVGTSGESLDLADTMMGPQTPQLAYSEVDDAQDFDLGAADVPMQTPMQPLSALAPEDYETEEEEQEPAEKRPRVLLLGSTVAAVVVVGFAALAVSVAISIRPTVSEQAVRLSEESVAGKYFPVAPGQGVGPDGPAWTAIEKLPSPGIEPDARTFQTKLLASPRGTGDTGAELIKYYKDGTIGVVPSGLSNVVDPPLPTGGIGIAPQAPEFLTRLIPDFSRWNPCQVLALVGNARLMGETAADVARTGTTAAANTTGNAWNAITDISELGVVIAAPQGTGNLFSTTGAKAATGTDIGAIPRQLFEPGNTEAVASTVLPQGTKILDTRAIGSLPGTAASEAGPTSVAPEKTSSLPILGEVLAPDTVEALPGVKGTAPVVQRETGLDLKQTNPQEVTTPIDVSGGLPRDVLPDSPATGVDPGQGLPGVNGPEHKGPFGFPSPGGSEPKQIPIQPPAADPVIEAPPPVFEAPPVQQAPPARRPIIELPPAFTPPKPDPVIEAPPVQQAPIIDIPAFEPPAPVVQAPVQQPKIPIIDIPVPVFKPPVVDAPAPAPPKLPSLPIPTLPFGGGLFGSGD